MDHPQPLSAADIVVLLAGCHGMDAVRTGVRHVADGIGPVQPVRLGLRHGTATEQQQGRVA